MASGLYTVYLVAAVVLYFGTSKIIFDKVNDTSEIVIDEQFHIAQGKAYCEGNYTYWDPKITTLPGLYIASSIVKLMECSTYNLRFVNLVCSVINLILFSSILRFVYGYRGKGDFFTVTQALNLSILPPLYFFSHVYYTDTISLMLILSFTICYLVNGNKMLMLLLGLCSVLMRQTNIVWIAMVFGFKMLRIFIASARVYTDKYATKYSAFNSDVDNSKSTRYFSISDVYHALKVHLQSGLMTFFKSLTIQDWLFIMIHVGIMGTFVGFVLWNGSVVVGDKTAHVAALHVPQMFYFLLFYGVFGLPYVVAKFVSTIRLMLTNKFKVLLYVVLFLVVVHFNTIAHPYLLADNRHYTFYVWNRWFGKYDFAVYASVPVYVFLLFSLYDNLYVQNCISFLLPYSVCTFVVLSLQQMIEVRYFLIPYLVLRLRFVRPSHMVVLVEFFWYVALNAVAFKVFFTKEIWWHDFDYPQRIIW